MNIKETRVAQLKKLLVEHNGAASFARKFDGIDASYLSQLINGHRPFGEKSARKIEKLCGLDPYYFDIVVDDKIIEVKAASSNLFKDSSFIGKCPVISWVQAGKLCELDQVLDYQTAEEFRYCPVKHSDKTYVLIVSGDSMWPEYPDQSEIFVDPTIEPMNNDDVVVSTPDNKATFKRLQITNEGKHLLALNPSWPNRIIEVSEGTMICGVVIYAGRKTR